MRSADLNEKAGADQLAYDEYTANFAHWTTTNMTRRLDDSTTNGSPGDWQDDSSASGVPEPDFAVRRLTLIALLAAAIILPGVYAAVVAYSDFRARDASAPMRPAPRVQAQAMP